MSASTSPIVRPALICSACNKSNSLDSQFCRACGHEFGPDDRKVAEAKQADLLTEGAKALGEGRTDEAMMIANTAVDANPSDPAAHSLLGDCYERQDDLASALECYERVVELTPDSTLDRIKVAHLRKLLTARPVPAPPDRRRALLSAAAATILVACVGGVVALLNAGTPTPAAQRPLAQNQTPSEPQPEVQNPVQDPAAQTTLQQPGSVAAQNPAEAVANPANPTNSSNRLESQVPPVPRGDGGGQLPAARPDGSSAPADSGPVEPVRPPIQGNITVVPEKTQPKPPTKTGPDPDPAIVTDATPTRTAAQGIYEIRPSAGSRTSNPNLGGSVPVETTRSEALLRTARQKYLTGDYASAADAYEKAVASGGDGASVQQRLAQTYEKLGRKGDAIAAYRRALQGYEAQLKRGDDPRTRAAMEATRDALRLMGG